MTDTPLFKTEQEIFDRVWDAMKAQKFKRSMISSTSCGYRGEKGSRCAVGALIPDKWYDTAMEGQLLNEHVWTKYQLNRVLPEKLIKFAKELQTVHDASPSAGPMKDRLIECARKNKLKVPS